MRVVTSAMEANLCGHSVSRTTHPIDASTNKVVRQWVGKSGDSLRFGFDSLWLTDYKKGLLSRIPIPQLLKQ